MQAAEISLPSRASGQASAGSRRAPAYSAERTVVFLLSGLWAFGVLVPILSLVVISFLQARGIGFVWKFSLHAYEDALVGFRVETVMRTLRIVAIVSILEFVLAFPFALWLAKGLREGWTKSVILALLVVPFFLSPAARTIVWLPILGFAGLVNTALVSGGLSSNRCLGSCSRPFRSSWALSGRIFRQWYGLCSFLCR